MTDVNRVDRIKNSFRQNDFDFEPDAEPQNATLGTLLRNLHANRSARPTPAKIRHCRSCPPFQQNWFLPTFYTAIARLACNCEQDCRQFCSLAEASKPGSANKLAGSRHAGL
jgi:hypothetical protein